MMKVVSAYRLLFLAIVLTVVASPIASRPALVGATETISTNSTSISLEESFKGTTLTDPSKWISMKGTATTDSGEWPCLTAASAPISASTGTTVEACTNQGSAGANAGDGVMRLTRRRPVGENPLKSSAGSLLYTEALSATEGIDISFSIRMESNQAADGISFFLKDGANPTNEIGRSGGALGYGLTQGSPGNGVPGALFGVGFDTYGSFSWVGIASNDSACSSTSRGVLTNAPQLADAKSSLVVRGPDVSGSKNGSSGYCYLAGTDVSYSSNSFQRVRIKVDPQPQGDSSTALSVYLAPQSSPLLLPSSPTLTTTVSLTSTFRFGFSASTGYWSNNHDLRDLSIRPAGPVVTTVASSVATGSGTGPTSGGTVLTITGSNIDVGAVVTVAGQPCTNVSVSGDGTELTCVSPAGSPGDAQVVVTNSNGGPSYGIFTYVNPTPTVTAVDPSSGTPNGGNTVTIVGTGFVDGATALLGGQPCTNVVVTSSTSLTCVAPSGIDGTVVDVVVTNVGDLSGTGVGLYTYTTAVPPEPESTPTTTPTTATTIATATVSEASSGAPTSGPVITSSRLPQTGINTDRVTTLAALLLLLGGSLLIFRRRLNTKETKNNQSEHSTIALS